MKMSARCVVMVVVAAVAAMVTAATTPPPPTQPRSQVKMVTSAPRPEALVLLKDCPVYVLGELRGVKKHGDTWLNDGSACELCKCVDGQKRCYYHYCNAGLTEGFMTPPSGRPPLDDEDREEGGEEGSGRPLLPDDYYKVINHPNTAESWSVGETLDYSKGGVGVNEAAQVPPMCASLCNKFCPWGFKLDKSRGCLRCKCHKCPSMAKCHLRCLGGLSKDARGCHMCACRSKGLSLLPQHHHPTSDKGGHASADPNTHTHSESCNDTGVAGCVVGGQVVSVGRVWWRGRCVRCRCVAAGYTECNVTRCSDPCTRSHSSTDDPCCSPCAGVSSVGGGEEGVVGSSWSDPATRQPAGPATPDANSHHRSNPSDGTTRSAVQASPVEWWQVWVIVTPLVLVAVLVCGVAVRYWRRYHHDKYHINAYRHTETEKLRPVTTADDHPHHNHNNHRIRHL